MRATIKRETEKPGAAMAEAVTTTTIMATNSQNKAVQFDRFGFGVVAVLLSKQSAPEKADHLLLYFALFQPNTSVLLLLRSRAPSKHRQGSCISYQVKSMSTRQWITYSVIFAATKLYLRRRQHHPDVVEVRVPPMASVVCFAKANSQKEHLWHYGLAQNAERPDKPINQQTGGLVFRFFRLEGFAEWYPRWLWSTQTCEREQCKTFCRKNMVRNRL